jgi:hypothetical protein
MTTIADIDTFLNFLAVAYAEAGPDRGSVDGSLIDDLGVVHFGLEVMKNRDVVFGVGHQKVARMTSSPNLRSPITMKFNPPRSFYERREASTDGFPRTSFPNRRPDTAASKRSSYEREYQAAINELHVQSAPVCQRRPETARSKAVVNDRFFVSTARRGDLDREQITNQKGRTLLRFWKRRTANDVNDM